LTGLLKYCTDLMMDTEDRLSQPYLI